MRLAVGLAVLSAVVAASCTRAEPAASAPPSVSAETECPSFVLERYDGRCVDELNLAANTYRVACVPVPDVLIDVRLDARWGRRPVRAIAAVPAVHAVAVTADGGRCGAYALALRTDLSDETRQAILREVERAASLPLDP